MAAGDKKIKEYFYVGIKWVGGEKEEEKEKRRDLIFNLAEKYGQVSFGAPINTKGTDIEFGFPISKKRDALNFLEEAVDSEYVAQTAIAKGDRGF